MAGSTALWLRFHPATLPPETQRTSHLTDLLNYFFPMAQHAARRLASGDLPLWNAEACSGVPFLATTQVAVFYPGSWLALALPAETALAVMLWVESVMAAVFTGLLLRSWRCNPTASAMGGLAFVSACVLHNHPWPPAVSTLLWIPWVFLCIERFVRGGGALWWLGLVLGISLQVLAGFPQYFVYACIGYAGFGALRVWQERVRERPVKSALATAAMALAALLLGLGIAGVQLLPAFELIGQSGRRGALAPEQVHYLLGPGARDAWQVLAHMLSFEPVETGIGLGGIGYIGVSALPLLLVGLAAGGRRALIALLAVGGFFTLLLSDGYLGSAAVLYERLAALPIFGSIRTPERLRVLFYFSALCIAAIGFDALARANRDAAWRRAAVALVAGAFATTAAGAIVWSSYSPWRPIGAAALGLGILFAPFRSRLQAALQCGLLALVALDLYIATPAIGIVRGFPADLGSAYFSATLDAIPPERMHTIARSVAPQRVAFYRYGPAMAMEPSHGVHRLGCFEPLLPKQLLDLHEKIHGEASHGPTLTGVPPDKFPAVYDVASAARIAVPVIPGKPWFRVNPDALPRAYWIDRYQVVSVDEALRHVAEGDVDFQRVVLLDRTPDVESREGTLQAAEILEHRHELVRIRVDAPSAGLLVLTDTDYVGWHATVNGQERTILRANGLYRAVAVDPGESSVTFTYRPASFRNGAALSVASLAVAAAVPLAARRRERLRRRR